MSIEDWTPKEDGEPLFGTRRDLVNLDDWLNRELPKRGLRERIADAWRGLRDGWKGAL